VILSQDILNLRAFLALDYSQIEIRILAQVSGDKKLIEQFKSGKDIHCAVGHELTGWPEEKIAKDHKMRRLVKNMHFAIVYGVSRDGLYEYVITKIKEQDGAKADLSGVSKERLGKLFDAYFVRYEGVKRFIDDIRAFVEKHHYVDTLFGPFRREINENDESRNTYVGNQAVNSGIQGSAHQLVLMAMALLDIKPRTYSLLQTPVAEVHDALYFYTLLKNLPEAYKQGKELLEHAVVRYAAEKFKVELEVPLIAEAEAGFCLGSLIEYHGQPLDEFIKEWRVEHVKVEKESWEKLLPGVSMRAVSV
jgi:DNA polymerase I